MKMEIMNQGTQTFFDLFASVVRLPIPLLRRELEALFFLADCRSPCWIIICNSQHFCATQVVRKTLREHGHVHCATRANYFATQVGQEKATCNMAFSRCVIIEL